MGCSLGRSTAMDLSPEDIEFLTTATNFTALEIKGWYKNFQSDCPNGRLSKAKFIEIYKMFFTTGNPQVFCEHVYRTFDSDGDGSINFKEFLLAIGITTGHDARAKLKWAFRMYDIDKNGTIDVHEMEKIIHALYEMLEERDADGNKIVEDAEAQQNKVRFIFERIDKDKDGRLSQEEFVDICAADPHLTKLLTAGTASGD